MNKQQFTNKIKEDLTNKINARLENGLPIITNKLMEYANILIDKLNEENNTNYSININLLINETLNGNDLQQMTHNEIKSTVYNLTNTNYSYSQLEDYLTNSADDIGYNDKTIYLSDGWEEIAINFKYTLTEEYNIIVHSIRN